MRILAVLLVFLCLVSPASATVPLSDDLCTFDSAISTEFKEILAADQKFDCSDKKYSVQGPKVWVKIPFKADNLAAGPVEVQGGNNGLTEISIYAVSKDGSVQSRHYSAQEVIDSWRPKSRYALIVPGSNTQEGRGAIAQVYIAISHPKVVSSISLIQLASTKVMDGQQLPLSVMFALLCGMSIMPFLYNAFFYGALRHSFMLWHSIVVLVSTVYMFSSSGIIHIIFPEITLITKFLINYWTLAIAAFASVVLLIKFVEPGKISDRVQATILISGVIPIIITALVIGPGDEISVDARTYYHASFLPCFFVTLYAMGHAVRRGSHAIRFQIAAWTPILLFGFDRIARGMDLYVGIPILDYGLYFMLVFENIVMALGVAYRVMQLKRHHEESLAKQVELSLLAETDGLTTIGNRRGFEKTFDKNRSKRRYDHLAILDIDFFKQVNDDYGHEAGDNVLRVIGRELSKIHHFSARIGGDEFALLIEVDGRSNRGGNPVAELSGICERLIKAVHKGVPEIKRPVTFSVGVAPIAASASLRSVMAVADKRLYNAKNNGRNQVVSFDIANRELTETSGIINA